jgi:hypothetical protein
MTPTVTRQFRQVSWAVKRSGSCPECGGGVVRSRTFTHTVNPFNRRPDGQPKTYGEVLADVHRLAEAWEPTGHDLLHQACAERLSPSDYESYRDPL